MAKFLQKKLMPGAIALLLVCGFFVFGTDKASMGVGPTLGDVIINEFYSDGSGAEWVELLNTSTMDISLTNFKLSELSNPNTTPTENLLLDLSGTIPAHGLVVFSVSGLNDGGDSVALYSGAIDQANLWQRVTYGTVTGYPITTGLETATTAGQSNVFINGAWSISSTPTKGWFNDAGQEGKAPLLNNLPGVCSPEGVCVAGVRSNIGSFADPTNATGLYFEKEGFGKISFSSALNLTDQGTVTTIKGLGEKLDSSKGHIKFSPETTSALQDAGATLTMYGLATGGSITASDLIVKTDADVVIPAGGPDYPVSAFSYDSVAGTVTFTASHFTQFTLKSKDNVYVSSATGDDSNDGSQTSPYATIQKAISEVELGGKINILPGTYNQDEANGYDAETGASGSSNFNIFVNKSITIQGVDNSGDPITNSNDVAAYVVAKRVTPISNISTIFIQADNVTITGLDIATIDIEAYNFKTISVIGNNTTIKNCKIHNLDQVTGIYVYDPNYNAETNVSHLQSYRFEGNYFDAGDPYPNDPDAPYASGIRFSSGAGWTGDIANRVITGNTFNRGSYAIQFVGPNVDGWDFYPVGAATINGNTFTNQSKGSVIAWGKHADAEGYGSIDWDGIFSGNTFDKAVLTKTSIGTVRSYDIPATADRDAFYYVRGIYSAIQKYPLNQVAQSGDTISVSAGNYNESLLIEKSLTLMGSGTTKPVISGKSGNGYIIKVNGASGVILDNLEINGGGTAVGNNDFDYGILVNNSGTSSNPVEIKNSIVKNVWKNSGNGVGVEATSYALVHHNTISSFHKRGIRFINSSGKFYNNEVIGDNVNGVERVQNLVNLWGGSTVEIYKNTLHNALSTPGSTPTWDSPGIFVSSFGGNGASQANIHDNEVYSCDTGIVMGSSFVGTSSDPAGNLTDTSSADIVNNNFHDLNNAINFEQETASATLTGNLFIDNERNIDNNDSLTGPTINAEKNWWGTNVETEIQNKIYQIIPISPTEPNGVDFKPYYTSSAKTSLSDDNYTDAVYTSDTEGQADLPSNDVVLDNDTKLDLSGGTSEVSGGSVTVGGESMNLDGGKGSLIEGVDLTEAQTIGDTTMTIGEAVKMTSSNGDDVTLSNSELTNVSVAITDGTTVMAPAGWDGKITPPKADTGATGNAPSGFSVGDTKIEVGSSAGILLFDKAVKITLTGVSGTVGYRPAGSDNWKTITTQCTSATDYSNISFPGECYFHTDGNTIIWTYHFTTFGSLITVSSGGGNNGGGGGGVAPVQTACSSVDYDEWQTTCMNNLQYRNIKALNPSGCAMTQAQRDASQRACGVAGVKIEEKTTTENKPAVQPKVLGVKTYPNGTLLKASNNKIYLLVGGKKYHIKNLKELRNYRGKKINKVSDETLAQYANTTSSKVAGKKIVAPKKK